MTDQAPTVAATVHYVSHGSAGGQYASTCRAAIVTEVGQWITVATNNLDSDGGHRHRSLLQHFEPEACSLAVINPTGVFFNGDSKICLHDEDGKAAGTWHWPEEA